MDSSTPRRLYNLRSVERQASRVSLQDQPHCISLRKRVSGSDAAEITVQKRQRTQQSVGPEFSSPDAMNQPRCIFFTEHRPVVPLPKRLSDLLQEKPHGNLGKLPTDAVMHVLSKIPYDFLGKMAMTSNAWMEIIVGYMRSGSLRVRWLADIAEAVDVIPEGFPLRNDPFYSIGRMIRLVTFNRVSEDRIAVLQKFMKAAYEAGASPVGLGRMIHAFAERPDKDIDLQTIDGLVEMCFSVFDGLKDELSSVFDRSDNDRELVGGENMDIMYVEMEMRKKAKALFLNHGSSDPAFGINKYFLSSLLKVFKNLHGALPTTLFYLLFAPTTIHNDSEVINWHRLSQVSVTSLEDAQELKPLSRGLYALLQCRNLKNIVPWTRNTIFNLMEEVTTYPSPWSMNTFVSLQVLEPELVPIGVIARMHRNHEDEAGDMICTMKMLLHRWDMDVQGVMDRVMDSIKSGLKAPQRRCLFDRCWEWHQRNIDELRARLGRFVDIQAEIESQIEVMPVLVKLL